MRAAIRARFRECYFLAVAAGFIAAGLYAAAVSSTPAESAALVEPDVQASHSQIASQRSAPAARPAQTVRPSVVVISAAPSRPAAAPMPDRASSPTQPAAAPDHAHVAMAASPAEQTVAQAPAKPTTTAIGGNAAAGRQVHKICQACRSGARFTLRSGIADGRMVYFGVGGPSTGKSIRLVRRRRDRSSRSSWSTTKGRSTTSHSPTKM
jgi:hypothetical protein